MSAPDEATGSRGEVEAVLADERVAAVIVQHRRDVEERVNADDPTLRDYGAACACGQWSVFTHDGVHADHVAAALAPVLDEVRAEALREAAGAMRVAAVDRSASHWRAHAWGNWLRDRADRIERGDA